MPQNTFHKIQIFVMFVERAREARGNKRETTS